MRRILLTGARSYVALDIARQLNAAGHTVFTAETHRFYLSRFSSAVKRSFQIPGPHQDLNGFYDALLKIVDEEKIDTIVPIFEDAIFLSQGMDRFKGRCELFCPPFEQILRLHNKYQLQVRLKEHGFATPKTTLLRSQDELDALVVDTKTVVKPCYGRASLGHATLLPGQSAPKLPIDEQNHWVAQSFVNGRRYCSYSVCRQGKVQAHSLYPVDFTRADKYCLTFESVDHEPIFEWTKRFAHLFEIEDRLEQAFFGSLDEPIRAKSGRQKQIAMGMLMYGWKRDTGKSFGQFLSKFFNTRDVIFDKSDLRPFLAIPLLFPMICWKSVKIKSGMDAAFLHDLSWNGQV